MDFFQVAAEFRQLKTQYEAGALSEADFKARLQDLMLQDEQGRWWMIGVETGQWYVHDGEKWVQAEPPAPQETPPVVAPPIAATQPPQTPAIRRTGLEAPMPRREAQPSRSWLWIGAGILGVVVAIVMIMQLARQCQATPPPTATSRPPSATPSATPAIPTTTPTDTVQPPTATPSTTPGVSTATPTRTSRPPTVTPTRTSRPPTATPTATLISPPITSANAARLRGLRTIQMGGAMHEVTFSANGRVLGSVSASLKIARLWTETTSDEILLRSFDRSRIDPSNRSALALSPDGQLLALTANDGQAKQYDVEIWRVADGALLQTLKGHTDVVWDVAFYPDGTALVSASSDGTAKLWRVSDGTLIRTMQGCGGYSMTLSPDGQRLAWGSVGKAGWCWMADGRPVYSVAHDDYIWGVAFSPDGGTLATASRDGTIKLWRVADGALLQTLTGHAGENLIRVAFSPNGDVLASVGAEDRSLRLWRVPDGKPLFSADARATNGALNDVAFSADGRLLAVASSQGVQLWGVR